MARPEPIDMDARKIVRNITVTVRIAHFREMKVRAWIGSRLMLLGAKIAGVRLVYTDNNDDYLQQVRGEHG